MEINSSNGAAGFLDNYIFELEKHLNQHNAQWLWSHKRWKAGYGPRDVNSEKIINEK